MLEFAVGTGRVALPLAERGIEVTGLEFSIGNLRTQAEQVECFRNAARHLIPGGRFVIEVEVPSLRRLPPGQEAVPFDLSEQHLAFDTYDLVTQQATSHHFTRQGDGTYRRGTHNFRYVWPSELDLMARLAGMELEGRYAGWSREAFTADSESHVSVWRRHGEPSPQSVQTLRT